MNNYQIKVPVLTRSYIFLLKIQNQMRKIYSHEWEWHLSFERLWEGRPWKGWQAAGGREGTWGGRRQGLPPPQTDPWNRLLRWSALAPCGWRQPGWPVTQSCLWFLTMELFSLLCVCECFFFFLLIHSEKLQKMNEIRHEVVVYIGRIKRTYQFSATLQLSREN